MRKLVMMTIILAAAAANISAHEQGDVKPAKISKDEVAGMIFERDSMVRKTRDSGTVTLDVTTLRSSDKKFTTGMYRAGKGYFDSTDPYGVDEFMFFLEEKSIFLFLVKSFANLRFYCVKPHNRNRFGAV